MIIESFKEAKNTLQFLTESLWILSAFKVIVETGAITPLKNGSSITEIEQVTKLPSSILEQMLHLLIKIGLIICSDNQYKLSPGMLDYIEQVGLENVGAQLRIAFGTTSEFIKLSRECKLIAGWHHTDEFILQAQGKYSEHVVNDYIGQDNELHQLLDQPGASFLDVGAGVARISLRLCDLYNNLRVVAIEPADVPFKLAKMNIEQSKHINRVELRKCYVESLDDINVFDGVWYPHMFLSDSAFIDGLTSVWRALKPGGRLITIALSPDDKSTSFYIKQLINSLYGGLRTRADVISGLEKAGFKNVVTVSNETGLHAITATKPV